MATIADMIPDREVSIARIFARSIATLVRNPAVTLGLALLIGAIPALLLTYLATSLFVGEFASGYSSSAQLGAYGLLVITILIGIVVSAMVQGALTRATVAESEGSTATLGECLAAGLSVVVPLIGLAIISSIGVFFGILLLIVPGIMLMLAWSVAAPAFVEERDGIFGALGRSMELTSGHRWKILGMNLVLFALYWLLSFVVGLIGLKMYDGTTTELSVGTIVGSVIVGTVYNAVWGTIQPSLYVELRNEKDGPPVGRLSHVFG